MGKIGSQDLAKFHFLHHFILHVMEGEYRQLYVVGTSSSRIIKLVVISIWTPIIEIRNSCEYQQVVDFSVWI